jgi:hypothetical protein
MRRVLVAISFAFLAIVALSSISTLASQDPAAKPVRTFKGGIMDEIKLYTAVVPAATMVVVVGPFSATDDDLAVKMKGKELSKDTKEMQGAAPHVLSSKFVSDLKKMGPYTAVSMLEAGAAAPENALVIEGRFIELDPGSRAARYVVGFGAGKSAVSVSGTVKDSAGTVLATFVQRRVGSAGAFGGNSVDKMSEDCRNIGEDLAKFLSAWANKKKL